MFKRMILTVTMLSVTILGGAASVYAADTQVSEETTRVGIEFEGIGTEVGKGPFSGRLAITHKPGSFMFGKNKATGALVTYDNIATKGLSEADAAQWLIVNDDRKNEAVRTEGEGSGDTDYIKGGTWTLSAQLSELKTNAGDVLPAVMIFDTTTAQEYLIGDQIGATGDLEPAKPLQGTTVKPFTPVRSDILVTSKVNLTAGKDAVKILSKTAGDQKNGGIATEIKNVKLQTQATEANADKSYSGTVTWTLSTGYKA